MFYKNACRRQFLFKRKETILVSRKVAETQRSHFLCTGISNAYSDCLFLAAQRLCAEYEIQKQPKIFGCKPFWSIAKQQRRKETIFYALGFPMPIRDFCPQLLIVLRMLINKKLIFYLIVLMSLMYYDSNRITNNYFAHQQENLTLDYFLFNFDNNRF